MPERPELFEGFDTHEIDVGDVSIFARSGGSGPPLLCLHGYPQSHACWHRMAPVLAQNHTVVVMDLRGYGQSSAPAGDEEHVTYSKRSLAADGVAVMRKLGHETFALMGHDRGGRVAYRMALDHPDAVEKLIVLDIIPTIEEWESYDAPKAIKSYHWPFLAQPAPIPETLISADPVLYLEHTIKSWTADKSLEAFDPRALDHYRAAFLEPARVHAMCEDYRAGATFDWKADRESRDAGKMIVAPVLALWGDAGRRGTRDGGGGVDVLGTWQRWADDVRGGTIDCGHFLPEENPDDTLAAVLPFLEAKLT